MLPEYFPVLLFIIVATAISLIIMSIPLFVAPKRKGDTEQGTAFECGFPAFENAHGRFDVRFYLVAILFVIFDLEIAFLFPWAVAFGTVGVVGFTAMMIFLLVLTVGFIYEWKKGALEWE